MKNPSMIDSPSGRVPEKASRWDHGRTETCGGEKVSSGVPCWFGNIWEFIEVELGQTELGWAHEAPGRACPPGAPWWLVATSSGVWSSPEASSVVCVQKKISKKFHCIWTSFGTDFLENQKQAENSN